MDPERERLGAHNLQSVRAYLLQEDFQQLWIYDSTAWAAKFLDPWCPQVMRSRIEPMKKVARTLRPHRELILNYFRARKEFSSGFRATELALYHSFGKLPEPELTPQVLGGRSRNKGDESARDLPPQIQGSRAVAEFLHRNSRAI